MDLVTLDLEEMNNMDCKGLLIYMVVLSLCISSFMMGLIYAMWGWLL